MTIIGIDPGKSGGIAWLPEGLTSRAIKMPETPRDVWDIINNLEKTCTHNGSVFAYIEKVGPMPKQGISSTAKFMYGAGSLEMALIASGIPHDFVAPGVWQRNLGCMTKGDKNITKRKAQRLFPDMKVTHAIADALLIAEYGRRLQCQLAK